MMLRNIVCILALIAAIETTPVNKDEHYHNKAVHLGNDKIEHLRKQGLLRILKKERCNNLRCNMVCPNNEGFGSPGSGSNGDHQPTKEPLEPDTSTSGNEAHSPTTKRLSQSTTPSIETTTVHNVTNTTTNLNVVNQLTNFTRYIQSAVSAIPETIGNAIRSSTKNKAVELRVQKHNRREILRKKLKTYKKTKKSMYIMVRQLLPNGCYVVCTGDRQPPQEGPNDQQGSPFEGEGSNEENTYEEGGDTAVEATVNPGVQRRFEIGNIRPFGPVDFMGMSDFGANGWPAMDPEYYEDRMKKQKEKQKYR